MTPSRVPVLARLASLCWPVSRPCAGRLRSTRVYLQVALNHKAEAHFIMPQVSRVEAVQVRPK